jgi:N-acyl-D-aspartate/D-glutamate deacylase
MLLYALPRWKNIMDLPREQRLEQFKEQKSELVSEMKDAKGMSGSIPFLKVGSVKSDENQRYQGQYLGAIAQEENKELGEVILDLSIRDNLDTEFQLQNVINADKQAVAKIVSHPLCHFGASDAGAHITQFCGTGDTSHLLQHYVRETNTFSLEEAIHKMTGELAVDWGLTDRGTLEEGKAADIVIFNSETVSVGKEEFVDDFPGEARRYVRKSEGYDVVIVNGAIAYQDGRYTETLNGRVV